MAFCLLTLIFIAFYYIGIPSFIYRRHYAKSFNYHIIFNDNIIEFNSEKARSQVEWSYYKRVWVTEKFYFLFSEGKNFSLIPRRAFKSEEQEKALENLLVKKDIEIIRF